MNKKKYLQKTNEIYSMLSDEEKFYLYKLSKNLNLQENSIIVEYGVFLGGSLQYIIKGLKENKTYNKNHIYAIDNFCVDNSKNYFNDIKNRFKNLGLNSYIKKDKIEWLEYLKINFKYITNLQLCKYSHKDFKLNSNKKISLIHLDLAKEFHVLKDICINLFKNFDKDTIIIHQDFFYYLSGTSIAFLYKMIKENKLQIINISSFGSIYLNNFKISIDDLNKFDANNINLLVHLIEESIYYFNEQINDWQKASLYSAIINLLKINNKNFDYYLNKLYNLENKKTFNHINRILQELKIR